MKQSILKASSLKGNSFSFLRSWKMFPVRQLQPRHGWIEDRLSLQFQGWKFEFKVSIKVKVITVSESQLCYHGESAKQSHPGIHIQHPHSEFPTRDGWRLQLMQSHELEMPAPYRCCPCQRQVQDQATCAAWSLVISSNPSTSTKEDICDTCVTLTWHIYNRNWQFKDVQRKHSAWDPHSSAGALVWSPPKTSDGNLAMKPYKPQQLGWLVQASHHQVPAINGEVWGSLASYGESSLFNSVYSSLCLQKHGHVRVSSWSNFHKIIEPCTILAAQFSTARLWTQSADPGQSTRGSWKPGGNACAEMAPNSWWSHSNPGSVIPQISWNWSNCSANAPPMSSSDQTAALGQ